VNATRPPARVGPKRAILRKGKPTSPPARGGPDPADRYDRVLELVANGQSLRQACDSVGTNRGDWWRAVQADESLFNRYARARELQAEALAGEIRELAESVTPQTANADRVRLDALRWIAAKLHPRVWGDAAGKCDAAPVQVAVIIRRELPDAAYEVGASTTGLLGAGDKGGPDGDH